MIRTESSEPLGDDVTALLPLTWRRAYERLMSNSGELAPLSICGRFVLPTLLALIRVCDARFGAWPCDNESGTMVEVELDGGKRVSCF
jgi:hypothetical protein